MRSILFALWLVIPSAAAAQSVSAAVGTITPADVSRRVHIIAHDSMGVARYIGRGNIFERLKSRRRAQVLELVYFSFYVGFDKTNEREIETLLIRAVGPQLYFNSRKKREDIHPGNIRDYEAGTFFFERQYKRGRKSRRQTAG